MEIVSHINRSANLPLYLESKDCYWSLYFSGRKLVFVFVFWNLNLFQLGFLFRERLLIGIIVHFHAHILANENVGKTKLLNIFHNGGQFCKISKILLNNVYFYPNKGFMIVG